MANQTTTRAGSGSTASAERDLGAATKDMANEVAERAGAVASRLPDAAASTRGAVEEAARRMEAGSDEMLAVGTSLSIGLAIGMLIGGAPRILVAIALIPATAMGFTLLDRYSGSRPAMNQASRRSA